MAHRDYRSTANVQIYVFKDRVEIVSPGGLPVGMTVADLGTKSLPRNPLLFGMLYRMDVVEQIGSGIRRIRHLCREHGVQEPIIDVSEHWVTVTFQRPAAQRSEAAGVARQSAPNGGQEAQDGRKEAQDAEHEAHASSQEDQNVVIKAQDGAGRSTVEFDGRRFHKWEIAVLEACAERPATGRGLLMASGYSTRTGNFKRAIESHLAIRLLELTIPDRPRSSKQRYRLTAQGRRLLDRLAAVRT